MGGLFECGGGGNPRLRPPPTPKARPGCWVLAVDMVQEPGKKQGKKRGAASNKNRTEARQETATSFFFGLLRLSLSRLAALDYTLSKPKNRGRACRYKGVWEEVCGVSGRGVRGECVVYAD